MPSKYLGAQDVDAGWLTGWGLTVRCILYSCPYQLQYVLFQCLLKLFDSAYLLLWQEVLTAYDPIVAFFRCISSINRRINRVQISSPSLTVPTANELIISPLSPRTFTCGLILFFLTFCRFPSSFLCLSINSIGMMPWPWRFSPSSPLHNDKNMNVLMRSQIRHELSKYILDSILNHRDVSHQNRHI